MVPLSDEVRMVPDTPTVTKVVIERVHNERLFEGSSHPKAIPLRPSVVPEVIEFQEEPSSLLLMETLGLLELLVHQTSS